MKSLVLAAALVVTAGTAFAQTGTAAGGPLGDIGRKTGTDPMGTTLPAPGAVIVDGPVATGTVVVEQPGMIPGTPPDGKGNYAGGYNGEAGRRMGTPQ